MPIRRLPILALGMGLILPPGELAAEVGDDPFTVIQDGKALCAAAPESSPCLIARARTVAVVADFLAEAGNSRDRGSFIAPVRALLADPSPEIRTSALYALAKLGPDASDTPALLALARDPISNVRAGAWAAAGQSPDPAARRIALRLEERPIGTGYGPDGPAFDPAALGLPLPGGLEYLWLTADLRDRGEVHFLSALPPEDLLAGLAPLADGPARPLAEAAAADPALGAAVAPFLDPMLYAAPRTLTLAATETLPARHLVVFGDLAFGQTGLAVVLADRRSMRPPPATPVEIAGDSPPEAAAFDAALVRRSGLKRGAEPLESDLFMAIVAAGGLGAAEYLEVYPEGAYAEEARAWLAAPRLVLDALSFSETEDVAARFANLPDGASAVVRIVPKIAEAGTLIERQVPDAAREGVRFEPDSRLVPGLYWAIASVDPGDGGPELALSADFTVTPGQAVLAADKADYGPGEQITVRFSGMAGDSQDYVSTALAGSPNTAFIAYAYAQGQREGSLTLPAPGEPGAYELRAFFREDESILRGSLPFSVSGTAVPSSTATTAPAAPGLPSPEARATLALDKPGYAPGETLTVTYAGMFGHPQDYVATAPAGAANSIYLQYRYTEGARTGTATLTAPTEPGDYELRAFFMEDEAILRASLPFSVR